MRAASPSPLDIFGAEVDSPPKRLDLHVFVIFFVYRTLIDAACAMELNSDPEMHT